MGEDVEFVPDVRLGFLGYKWEIKDLLYKEAEPCLCNQSSEQKSRILARTTHGSFPDYHLGRDVPRLRNSHSIADTMVATRALAS